MKELTALDGTTILVDDQDAKLLGRHTWFRVNTGSALKGTFAARISGNLVYLAHLVLGPLPRNTYASFVNQDPTDCRRANLVTLGRGIARHRLEVPKRGGAHASTFRGVYWRGKHSKVNPWGARVRFEGRVVSAGVYPTEEAAARGHDKKARELYGPFAAVNFAEETA